MSKGSDLGSHPSSPKLTPPRATTSPGSASVGQVSPSILPFPHEVSSSPSMEAVEVSSPIPPPMAGGIEAMFAVVMAKMEEGHAEMMAEIKVCFSEINSSLIDGLDDCVTPELCAGGEKCARGMPRQGRDVGTLNGQVGTRDEGV